MTFERTPAYMRDWRLRITNRWSNRPSNAKNRCADCTVEILRGALRCRICGPRHAPSRRKA